MVNAAVTDVVGLSMEELKRFEFLFSRYRTLLQAYKDQQKSLTSIQQYIVQNIGNYYSTIADEYGVPQELALLQRRVKPTSLAITTIMAPTARNRPSPGTRIN